jgi:hypothetical protein
MEELNAAAAQETLSKSYDPVLLCLEKTRHAGYSSRFRQLYEFEFGFRNMIEQTTNSEAEYITRGIAI